MSETYSAQTLSLSGPDALAFAQAQLSGRVDDIPIGQWRFNAWLDAKGRVIAFMHVARVDADTLLLLLRGGDAQTIADAMKRYVFRSKLRIDIHAPRRIATGAAMPLHAFEQHGDGSIALGVGSHSMIIGDVADDEWHAHDVQQGWPWLPDETLSQYLPPMLSFERLGAVSFDKGCYPGQEIVARLHYRGGNKRHLSRVVLSPALPAGSVLRKDGSEVARVLNAVSSQGRQDALAILADDAIETLKNNALQHHEELIHMSVLERWSA